MAGGQPLLDFGRQQMLVEDEVDALLAQAGVDGRVYLRQGVGAQGGVGEHQVHEPAAGDVVGLEDLFQVGRILGMHHATFHHRQDALLHVLQDGLDIGGFLA